MSLASLSDSHTHVACNNMHGQRGRNRKLKVGQQISGGETIKVHSRSRLDQRSFLSSPKPFFKLPRKLSNRATQWLGYFVHSLRKLTITDYYVLSEKCMGQHFRFFSSKIWVYRFYTMNINFMGWFIIIQF